MIFRGMAAASCMVLALAAPARAQDGCTSQLVQDLGQILFVDSEDDPPYPIVTLNPDGSVTVHPNNVVPAVDYALDRNLATAGQIVTAVAAWADCVG